MKMSSTKHHTPMRTCVACRQVRPKRYMVRLVHSADGEVKPDPKGKLPGRGAYLCKRRGCWEQAFKKDRKNRIAGTLKTSITQENRGRLIDYAMELPVVETVVERAAQ
ncbi:MAG: YlxR family protein [Dehalococcoidia bacterium]